MITAIRSNLKRQIFSRHVAIIGTRSYTKNTPPPDLPVPTYSSLATATAEDFSTQDITFAHVASTQADRVLTLLKNETDKTFLHCLDLLEHSLQSATRAYRDGADEEMVVVALLHDIGEVLSPGNHGEVAAGLLRPYVSDKNHWLLLHHEIYQAHYYADAMNERPNMTPIDPDIRDRFSDHKYHEHTIYFCEKYDQTSFDKEYDTLPLEFFEPMVRNIFARTPWKYTGELSEPAKAKKELASAYPQ
jgi:predicted HD phosphohydrolase